MYKDGVLRNDLYNKKHTWQISKEGIVEIENDKIKTVKSGIVKISIHTVEGISGYFVIRVI